MFRLQGIKCEMVDLREFDFFQCRKCDFFKVQNSRARRVTMLLVVMQSNNQKVMVASNCH